MSSRRGPRCRARNGHFRCTRRQNHVGRCWSHWQHTDETGRYTENRYRYKWYRHGMKWTL